MSSRKKSYDILLTVCGIIAGVIAVEASLHRISHSSRGKYFEIRQYSEGISVSHYASQDPPPLNWRLTGNKHIEGAPVLLIVGDSYIAAHQVNDEQTMGSLIERWSRSDDFALNVRQYGVPGGSISAYAGYAEPLLGRWKPFGLSL